MSAAAPLVIHPCLDSTQDELHRLALAGAPDGAAVLAREQRQGRGRRGDRWVSPPGGLWLSVLRRPGANPAETLSLAAGLAVAQALERSGVGDIMIKWPNDLMLDDAKVGGVLSELRWQGAMALWAALGVGINVVNRPPPGTAVPATWLGRSYPDLTVDAIVPHVLQALRSLPVDSPELSPEQLAALNRRDWLRDRPIEGPVAGRGLGIEADGSLAVLAPDGRRLRVRSGPIAPVQLTPEQRPS